MEDKGGEEGGGRGRGMGGGGIRVGEGDEGREGKVYGRNIDF